MAELTISQYIKKLERQKREVAKGKFVEIAARSSMAEMAQRIFTRGEKTSGGKIGGYDTTNELWASDESLPRKGTNKGKTGKPIKTSYYPSYRALRQQQGREPGFVNLRLFGRLQSDFSNAKVSAAKGIGTPKPIKINNLLYRITLKQTENQQKRRGLEKKYGTIFDLSKKEDEIFDDVSEFELNKILSA